jgi:hypothetical protein
MCISIFDMCAANQAGEARHDSVGLAGGSLRHYRSVAGIREQSGRASTIKLSRGDRALVRMARLNGAFSGQVVCGYFGDWEGVSLIRRKD